MSLVKELVLYESQMLREFNSYYFNYLVECEVDSAIENVLSHKKTS